MEFYKEKGIGYCGLACVLCSNEACQGCSEKIAKGDKCTIGICAADSCIDGCHVCQKYPCEEKMLHNKRIRAFNRYMCEFGKAALIDRLYENYKNGITYHKPDKTPGDYDLLETEDEIYKLLRYGRN